MSSSSLNELLELLSQLDDPRQKGKVIYPLEEMLLLALAATMSGADDFVEIVSWGKMQSNFLKRFYPYISGIPSHDALNDVFNALDDQLFSDIFSKWIKTLQSQQADIIAIDGKTSRRSGSDKQKPLHLVSAWASEQNLVLGQEATDEKSNEITAIPELLKRLSLSGCLVTIDAMGTQKTIAKQIIEAEGDYLLAVKGNQKNLSEDIRLFFDQPPKGYQFDTHQDINKDHGRLEVRECRICTDVDWLNQRDNWQGLSSILEIKSTVTQNNKTTTNYRYYISSLSMSAASANYAVRSHWGIENKLHWVLDVMLKEDQARVRTQNGAKNMAIVRHMTTNLLRLPTEKSSLKVRRKKAAWSINYLEDLLRQKA